MEQQAQLGPLVIPVLMELMGQLDQLELLVILGQPVPLGQLGRLVTLELMEQQAQLGPLVILVLMELMGRLDQLELLVILDLMGRLERLERPVTLELMEQPVQLALLVILDLMGRLERLEQLVQPGQLVSLERLVLLQLYLLHLDYLSL